MGVCIVANVIVLYERRVTTDSNQLCHIIFGEGGVDGNDKCVNITSGNAITAEVTTNNGNRVNAVAVEVVQSDRTFFSNITPSGVVEIECLTPTEKDTISRSAIGIMGQTIGVNSNTGDINVISSWILGKICPDGISVAQPLTSGSGFAVDGSFVFEIRHSGDFVRILLERFRLNLCKAERNHQHCSY